MPQIPGIGYETAIRVLKKVGFAVIREGKHTIMSNGVVHVSIPRHRTINAYTMGGIAKDAGLSPREFLDLV
ncbi:MAG: type II toxin-antitoxin system HicA family toxin [Candidatus Hydrogenedentes bacterium]|nr:type II toxin-antitoxin system HicA family toxin [Candidatus Hydrogenedentota bacterium]